MFQKACSQLSSSIFGVRAGVNNQGQITYSLGSGFLIAPNIIATTAHGMRDLATGAHHNFFEVICSVDIGKTPVPAQLIFQDPTTDVAFLRIMGGNYSNSVSIKNDFVNKGTMIGTLGFPLSEMTNGIWILKERFQHGFVSGYFPHNFYGHMITFYETDNLMYSGSSGCPAFTSDGSVIGMQCGNLNSKQGNQLSISIVATAASIMDLAVANGLLV